MSVAEPYMKLAGLPLSVTSRNFGRLVIAAVIVGFLAVMAAGAGTAMAVYRDQQLTRAMSSSNSIQAEMADLLILLERTETSRRGYLLTRDPANLATFEDTARRAPQTLERLQRALAGRPDELAILAELKQRADAQILDSRRSIVLVESSGPSVAVRSFQQDGSGERIRRLRSLVGRLAAIEKGRLTAREALQARSVRNLYLALGLAAPLLLIVAFGSTFVIFRYTRDLAESGDILRRLNEGLEAAVAERTADLARANQEIQRFAYIVSHDLRSPLVNVMGFTAELETSLKPIRALIDKVEAEAPALLGREAVVAAREDAPEAIGFIRKSTQKMDRLINAILQLSRNGRRPLKREHLDMSQVLNDVAETLRARADAAGARIVVAPDLPPLVGDRLAVEQIFGNLMENAVKYGRPGVPGLVEVRGRKAGGVCVYCVSDNGRGIDPKDHERVFELFRRSGPQDQPGEGIGLANVRALIHRLGGTIEIESALDQGATFRVSLPAVLRTDQETAA